MLAGLLFVAVAFGILSGLGSSLLFNYTLTRNKHLVPGDYIYYVRGDEVITAVVDITLLKDDGVQYHVTVPDTDFDIDGFVVNDYEFGGFVVNDYEFGDGAFTDIDDAVLRVLELSESSVPA